MRKSLLLFVLLCVCYMIANAELPSHLVITCKDGSEITYLLLDEPKITFERENMVISSNIINMEHQLNTVEQITYENVFDSSMGTVCKDTTSYCIKDNILEVVNESVDFTVHIYDINGRCVINKICHKSESASISLDNLEKGEYILTINFKSYKFYIR